MKRTSLRKIGNERQRDRETERERQSAQSKQPACAQAVRTSENCTQRTHCARVKHQSMHDRGELNEMTWLSKDTRISASKETKNNRSKNVEFGIITRRGRERERCVCCVLPVIGPPALSLISHLSLSPPPLSLSLSLSRPPLSPLPNQHG